MDVPKNAGIVSGIRGRNPENFIAPECVMIPTISTIISSYLTIPSKYLTGSLLLSIMDRRLFKLI
jgi:hypothetical protein